MSAMAASLGAGIPIKNRITCPHCWSSFPPDQTLWVAQHPDLAGDPRLGSDHPKRSLPSRFNLQGDALDAALLATSWLVPNATFPFLAPSLK